MRILFAAAVIFLAGCNGLISKPAPAAPLIPQPTVEEKTEALAKLREYTIWVNTTAPGDEESVKRLLELESQFKDSQLSVVADWSLTVPGRPLAFGWARLLLDRGRYDDAATVIVAIMQIDSVKRQNGIWKWWDWNFGKRPNNKEMIHAFVDSLFKVYDKGSRERRIIVAEMFNMPPEMTNLPADEFRQRIPGLSR